MTIRAQSADGVIHEFPDGTDPAVIDRVMKGYATKAQPAPAGPGPGAAPTLGQPSPAPAGAPLAAPATPAPAAPPLSLAPGPFTPAAPAAPGGQPQPVPGPGMGATAAAVGDAVRGAAANAPLSGTQNAAGWGRSVQNGLLFGFGDEASAGLQATLDWLGGGLGVSDETGGWSKAYDERLAQGRALDKKFSAQQPVFAALGEGLGGLAAAATAPASLVSAQGQTLGGQMVRGATTGAGAGAVYGFGSGEGGVENRLSSAGDGAMLGGALGFGFPVVAAVGRGVLSAGKAVTGMNRPADKAAERIANAFKADDIDVGAAVMEAMRRHDQGLPTPLLGVGGENVQGLARAAASIPGPGRQEARGWLQDWIGQEGGKFNTIAQRSLGDADFAGTIETLTTQRAQDARPLYEKAFAAGQGVTNDRLQAILADPIMQGGLKRGLEVQRIEALARGEKFNPTDYAITGFNEAGDPIISGVPNFRLLDAAKRGLDAILEDYRDTVTGRLVLDQRGRAIDELRRAYVKELRRINPAYGEALDAWAGPTQSRNAISLGQEILTMPVDELRALVGRLSPADRDFFRLGVRRALEDKVSTSPDVANLFNSLTRRNDFSARLALAFDDPRQLESFLAQLRAERELGTRLRQTDPKTGSQTIPRSLELESEGTNAALQFGEDLSRSGLVSALLSSGWRNLRRLTGGGMGKQEAAETVRGLLGEPYGDLVQALVKARGKLDARSRGRAQRLLGTLGFSLPALGESEGRK